MYREEQAVPGRRDPPADLRAGAPDHVPRAVAGRQGASPRQPWILVHADEIDINKDNIISRKEIVGEATQAFASYDANNDGTHEGVKAEFDPDFPGDYSGTVTIEVDLYIFNGTLVNSASGTYSLTGDDYDSFELDLGTVSTSDDFYLVGKIIFNSITTDQITTSTFELGLLPFFYSFDYITYDANNN